MNTLFEILIVAFIILKDIGTPVLLTLGWTRWSKQMKTWSIPSVLSLIGFALATSSALLAFGTLAYAQGHQFGFYDPSLLRIYRWAAVLSVSGFCFALGGVWRKNALRWLAPLCSFGTFAFWVFAAAGE